MSKEGALELVQPVVSVNVGDDKIVEENPLQLETPEVDSKVVDEGVANRQSIYDKYNNNSRPQSEEVVETPPLVEDKATKDEPADKPDDSGKVKIKIYGQERLVDKKVVDAEGGVKAYQIKVAAAEKAQIERDRRFIEQERTQIEQEKRDLAKVKQNLSTLDNSDKNKGDLPSDDHAAKRAKLKAAVEAAGASLLDGELGEFSETLTQYLSDNPTLAKSQEPIDVEKIVQEVEQRTIRNMTEKQLKEQVREAQEIFAVEYPELASDPDLFAKTDRRTLLLAEEYPDKSPLEIVRLAGEEVRKVYAPRPRPTPTTTTTTRDQKLAEKRTMSKPSGGSDRAVAPPEPKQPTRSDYVLELQKQRGQV